MLVQLFALHSTVLYMLVDGTVTRISHSTAKAHTVDNGDNNDNEIFNELISGSVKMESIQIEKGIGERKEVPNTS